MGNMKKNLWRSIIVTLSVGVVLGIASCGVDVDVPDKPPSTSQIKGWSDRRVATLEEALRKKDWKLPSRVKGLMRYLRGLGVNLTVGPGKKFKNTGEALQELNRVIVKLENWYNQSLNRREGDSDADRAKLQTILDEVKEVLKNVNVGKRGTR